MAAPSSYGSTFLVWQRTGELVAVMKHTHAVISWRARPGLSGMVGGHIRKVGAYEKMHGGRAPPEP